MGGGVSGVREGWLVGGGGPGGVIWGVKGPMAKRWSITGSPCPPSNHTISLNED